MNPSARWLTESLVDERITGRKQGRQEGAQTAKEEQGKGLDCGKARG